MRLGENEAWRSQAALVGEPPLRPHRRHTRAARTTPCRLPLAAESPLTASFPIPRPRARNEFGPDIAYREAGFLSNPALPGTVRGSVVHVLPCKKGAVGCASGENPATLEFDRLFMQEGLDSERVARALSSAASISVLNFTDVARSVGNFTRAADYARFTKRLGHYGGVFCCIDAHPGHVHYDLLWDVPHTDRFGRVWGGEAPWRPVTGP